MEMEGNNFKINDEEYEEIDKLYDECLIYLNDNTETEHSEPDYDTIQEHTVVNAPKPIFKIEDEKSSESIDSVLSEPRSERLRKLSQQLPKIIITQSSTSLEARSESLKNIKSDYLKSRKVLKNNKAQSSPSLEAKTGATNDRITNNEKSESKRDPFNFVPLKERKKKLARNYTKHVLLQRGRFGYGDYPKRLVSKTGMENVALISNVPFEKIRLLNDTFHTLINLRWRWIVIGTVVVHFTIWLVFAVFWYITALAHYDFEPDPPNRTCITGGKDFVTIFLASVEAQTTIGFGDRAIDEECPESIFLFVMQLILGTGLSGVLTCVVYAKLTRPEKLSRDGVGFSKKAVINMRDGRLCLMMRAWDLNYDHIISSEFTAHFVNTYRTKEGEVLRYYARSLRLQQRQFLLWPVTLVHVIDAASPLYEYTPDLIANNSYEITLSLKGASASMGTFTQSQTSYLPREVAWGYRFPSVVNYNSHKQKYVIDHKKLDTIEPAETPDCCARDIYRCSTSVKSESPWHPSTPSNFSDKIAGFRLGRSSSFRKKTYKI